MAGPMPHPKAPLPPTKGRGTAQNPPNRFEPLAMPWDADWLESQRLAGEQGWQTRTEYFNDDSKSVLSRNDSPDLAFDWSLNPYRGCEHGCIYCYARPTHEYLGFSAGLDFESRIMVKRDAAALLERELRSRRWKPQPVLISGVTDCYQPVEKQLGITRACLEVFLHYRHPVELITKNALVLRDLDLLQRLAELNLVRVTLSVTTLDARLATLMEPRASAPRRRLEAVAAIAAAGVPVGVNLAPVIPGLNDHEIPPILAAAAERGAAWAMYIMLRLPGAVKELFCAWLEENYPDRAAKVLEAIRQVRGGRLADSRFGVRMRGEGVRAEAIAQLFGVTCRHLGLNRERNTLATHHFQRDVPPLLRAEEVVPARPRQQELFAERG